MRGVGVKLDVKPLSVMNFDIFSNVLEFCRPRERRIISTVSLDGNSSYKSSAERLSLREMSSLVRERKKMWELPVIRSRHDQCLPGVAKGREHQFTEYAFYQCKNMLNAKGLLNSYGELTELDEDVVFCDDEHLQIMMVLSSVAFEVVQTYSPRDVYGALSYVDSANEDFESLFFGGCDIVDVVMGIVTEIGIPMSLGHFANC